MARADWTPSRDEGRDIPHPDDDNGGLHSGSAVVNPGVIGVRRTADRSGARMARISSQRAFSCVSIGGVCQGRYTPLSA